MVKIRGKYGSNMIKVTLRFWTNNTGTNDKKVAWESGVVYLNANKDKGIKSQFERFEQLEDMPNAVKKVLKLGEVKLKPSSKNYVKL